MITDCKLRKIDKPKGSGTQILKSKKIKDKQSNDNLKCMKFKFYF